MAELPLLAAGFAAPLLVAALALVLTGAWPASTSKSGNGEFSTPMARPLPHPFQLVLTRILNWLGFHAALLLGATLFFLQVEKDRLRFASWIALSFAAVCFGNHFAPRYFCNFFPRLSQPRAALPGSPARCQFWLYSC